MKLPDDEPLIRALDTEEINNARRMLARMRAALASLENAVESSGSTAGDEELTASIQAADRHLRDAAILMAAASAGLTPPDPPTPEPVNLDDEGDPT